MDFSTRKELLLKKVDLSKKGSIDSRIIELVNFINSLDNYVTTSSCSGRAIVFTNTNKKKGCIWLFVSHDVVSSQMVIDSLKSHNGSAVLKFEPFIMHVLCSTMESAKKLHAIGIQSGFRNSGLTVGKSGKITMAIRGTLSLEIPLSHNGVWLVSDEYLTYVTNICNEKMKENWNRTERLFSNLRASVSSQEINKLENDHESGLQRRNVCEYTDKSVQHFKESDHCIDMFCDGFENLLK